VPPAEVPLGAHWSRRDVRQFEQRPRGSGVRRLVTLDDDVWMFTTEHNAALHAAIERRWYDVERGGVGNRLT
jgi:hypothetical protein